MHAANIILSQVCLTQDTIWENFFRKFTILFSEQAMSASGGTPSDIFKRYNRLHLGDKDPAPKRRAPGFKTRPNGLDLSAGDRLELRIVFIF